MAVSSSASTDCWPERRAEVGESPRTPPPPPPPPAPAPDATVVLKDGSTVAVRGLQPGDEAALTAFYSKLSPESQAFRFFCAPADVSEIAKRLVISDYESQFGLVAMTGRNF